MEDFNKFLNKKGINLKSSPKEQLQDLLSLLHFIYWHYNTSHWQVNGDSYYEKHLLFQRLYEKMQENIDDLAEKLVSYFDSDSVDLNKIVSISLKFSSLFKDKDLIQKSIDIENYFQDYLSKLYNSLKKNNKLTLGLDDFIMSLANDHEANLYLLNQYKK